MSLALRKSKAAYAHLFKNTIALFPSLRLRQQKVKRKMIIIVPHYMLMTLSQLRVVSKHLLNE